MAPWAPASHNFSQHQHLGVWCRPTLIGVYYFDTLEISTLGNQNRNMECDFINFVYKSSDFRLLFEITFFVVDFTRDLWYKVKVNLFCKNLRGFLFYKYWGMLRSKLPKGLAGGGFFYSSAATLNHKWLIKLLGFFVMIHILSSQPKTLMGMKLYVKLIVMLQNHIYFDWL